MKEIVDLEVPVSELKRGFGNPRKITKKKREELRESIEAFGNFGIVLIDEEHNIIAGNQRCSVIEEMDPAAVVSCKMLKGYTEAELKAINIKDNTHSGEWDLDLLADWTSDLVIDLGIDVPGKDPDERKIKEMDPIRYERYDYVVIACRNEVDYLNLTRALGIDDKKVLIAGKRRIKARAVWYDQMKCQIVPREEVGL